MHLFWHSPLRPLSSPQIQEISRGYTHNFYKLYLTATTLTPTEAQHSLSLNPLWALSRPLTTLSRPLLALLRSPGFCSNHKDSRGALTTSTSIFTANTSTHSAFRNALMAWTSTLAWKKNRLKRHLYFIPYAKNLEATLNFIYMAKFMHSTSCLLSDHYSSNDIL